MKPWSVDDIHLSMETLEENDVVHTHHDNIYYHHVNEVHDALE